MKHDPRRVLEILLDELAAILRLSPEAIDRCRQGLTELLRPRWPVLFLATGDEPPPAPAIESFRALVALGVEPHLLCSRSFAEIWPPGQIESRLGPVRPITDLQHDSLRQLPERFPLLCVLTLSENTVTKTVLGLRDAKPPLVLRAFLERGKPVLAVGQPPQRLELDGHAAYWSLPLAMRQWLSDGYRTLEQWGLEFIAAEQLIPAVRRHLFDLPEGSPVHFAQKGLPASDGRVVLTREDVHAARNRKERAIALPAHAIVTEEAREWAERWGIVIQKS